MFWNQLGTGTEREKIQTIEEELYNINKEWHYTKHS